jgi:hypothetical protein
MEDLPFLRYRSRQCLARNAAVVQRSRQDQPRGFTFTVPASAVIGPTKHDA